MKATSYPQWKGFERVPRGCLLEQFIDLSNDMGIAYERSVNFYKDYHTHDRLMLVFPRGACRMEVRTKQEKTKYALDSKTFLIVPHNLEHDDEGSSAIYDTFALFPDTSLIKEAGMDLGIGNMAGFFSKCKLLIRNQSLDQKLQEYFFARVINKKDGRHRELLEYAIIREILILYFNLSESPKESIVVETNVAARAVRFIETNLFAALTNQIIAKKTGSSESDLLRKFRVATTTTPYAYIKNRRLEEAIKLIETSNTPIGEVALLVGYNNFGAFTDAFRDKFGKSPREFRA